MERITFKEEPVDAERCRGFSAAGHRTAAVKLEPPDQTEGHSGVLTGATRSAVQDENVPDSAVGSRTLVNAEMVSRLKRKEEDRYLGMRPSCGEDSFEFVPVAVVKQEEADTLWTCASPLIGEDDGDTALLPDGSDSCDGADLEPSPVFQADDHMSGADLTHGKKLYQCNICQSRFTKSSSLLTHGRIHTGEKPYSCEFCQKPFNQSSHLTNHRRIHTGEKPYQCGVCEKLFSHMSNYKKHVKTHSGDDKYECKLCHQRFSRIANLMRHGQTHPAADTVGGLDSGGSLIHTIPGAVADPTDSNKLYQCDICKKRFTKSSSLLTHGRIHTGEKPYSCEFCQKQFNQSSHLTHHRRTHTGEKPYQCKLCRKLFSHMSNYKKHVKTHSGEKFYSCKLCAQQFSHMSSLKRHLRKHATGDPVPAAVREEGCGPVGDVTRGAVKKHHQCKFCKKWFTQLYSLRTHVRTHTGEKPYSCEYCRKPFNKMSTLVCHRRTHTGEKPFRCELCGKPFSQSSHLTHHRRTHTGEKPFRCDVCEKLFSHVSNYKKHVKTHNSGKTWPCKVCSKLFSHMSSLKRHRQTHAEVRNKSRLESPRRTRNPCGTVEMHVKQEQQSD